MSTSYKKGVHFLWSRHPSTPFCWCIAGFLFMKQVICHHFALHHPPILIMGKTIDCYHCEMQGLSGLCGLQETLYLMCQISAIVLADDYLSCENLISQTFTTLSARSINSCPHVFYHTLQQTVSYLTRKLYAAFLALVLFLSTYFISFCVQR